MRTGYLSQILQISSKVNNMTVDLDKHVLYDRARITATFYICVATAFNFYSLTFAGCCVCRPKKQNKTPDP